MDAANITALVTAVQPVVWPIALTVMTLVVGLVLVVRMLSGKNVSTPWGTISQPTTKEAELLEKPEPTTLTLPEPTATLSAVEESIKETLVNNPEPMKALIRELAVARVRLFTEGVYSNIYNSQIKFLQHVVDKGGTVSLAAAKKYYQDVRKQLAPAFDAIGFDAWVQYLITNGLLVVSADKVVALELARDFLTIVLREKPENARTL
jgi:hypothetical protein